ncbi:MAG: tetratricopeptide repeat protein [Bacteroidia bacterium]|nr:tetratricopeptide repeat protein [Bacteroidia bacterium]
MGIFDFFKGKENKQPDSPAKEHLDKAREHFNSGAYQETLRTLISGFKADVTYLPLYRLASETLGKLGGAEEKSLFDAVIANNHSSEAYNNLGSFYHEIGHYDMAQTFYEKAIQLDPLNNAIYHDLAICYARRFQIKKAIDILSKSDSNDFWDMYYLNKCKLLNGETKGMQPTIDMLRNFLQNQEPDENLTIAKLKVEELHETLQRFNTVPEIRTHIREWHYIQYGGVILDFFEMEEEKNYVAGGRYVASWGSNQAIKNLAVNLKQYLNNLNQSFIKVVAMPDRDSEIVGRVIAHELNLDFDLYDRNQPNTNCFIVSAESTGYNYSQELSTIQNGQVVFAVNHCWLQSSNICPDIIGFMTQTYSFPWSGGGFRISDDDNKKVEKIPEDTRPALEIVQEIINIKNETEEINNNIKFYLDRKDYLKGTGNKTNNNRYNFSTESPVLGSYFG